MCSTFSQALETSRAGVQGSFHLATKEQVMSLHFRSFETVELEDTLELQMKRELQAAEEKYKDECWRLEVRYQFGHWNLVDNFGRSREDVTSQTAWDCVYATRHHSDPEGFPMDDEWGDLYDSYYCYDCGSPMCSGGCLWHDDPLDLECRADSEADVDDSSDVDDGCMSCGNFSSHCTCHDDDPMFIDEWYEEAKLAWMDRHDAENFHVFRDVLTRRLKFLHLRDKAAADAEDSTNSDSHGNSHGNAWKRSNRTVHKQWARHKLRQCKLLAA